MVRQKRLKKVLARAEEFRKKLGKRTGITSSSAEIIREGRDRRN